MHAHKTDENTNPPTRWNGFAGRLGKWLQMGSKKTQSRRRGVNGSKWTHTKQMKTQIRCRGGMAPPGAWGKWLQKGFKKNGAAGAGENWGPLKSENDLEGVNFRCRKAPVSLKGGGFGGGKTLNTPPPFVP